MSWYWHIDRLIEVKEILQLDEVLESECVTGNKEECYRTFILEQTEIKGLGPHRRRWGHIDSKYNCENDNYFKIKGDTHEITGFQTSSLKLFNEDKEKMLEKGILLDDSLKRLVGLKWTNKI